MVSPKRLGELGVSMTARPRKRWRVTLAVLILILFLYAVSQLYSRLAACAAAEAALQLLKGGAAASLNKNQLVEKLQNTIKQLRQSEASAEQTAASLRVRLENLQTLSRREDLHQLEPALHSMTSKETTGSQSEVSARLADKHTRAVVVGQCAAPTLQEKSIGGDVGLWNKAHKAKQIWRTVRGESEMTGRGHPPPTRSGCFVELPAQARTIAALAAGWLLSWRWLLVFSAAGRWMYAGAACGLSSTLQSMAQPRQTAATATQQQPTPQLPTHVFRMVPEVLGALRFVFSPSRWQDRRWCHNHPFSASKFIIVITRWQMDMS